MHVEKKLKNESLSRRSFLKNVFGLVAGHPYITGSFAANALFEYGSQKILWNNQETKVELLNNSYETHTNTANLVIAGLGQKSGHDIAQALQPTLSKLGPVTYASFPDSGYGNDFEELYNLANVVKQSISDLNKENLNIYCHSMGASVYWNLLPYINSLNIQNVVFDCSPFSMADAHNEFFGHILAEAKRLPLGVEMKLLGQSIDNLLIHPNNDLTFYERIGDTFRQAITGVSPILDLNQMSLLKTTNPYKYAEFGQSDTNYLYLMPMDSTNDDTVNTDTSFRSFSALLGNKISLMRVPKGGHANPTDRSYEYNQMLSMWFGDYEARKANFIY